MATGAMATGVWATLFLATGVLTSLLVASGAQPAQAQLFGARSLGQGVSSPSAQALPGGRRPPLSGRSGRAAFQHAGSNTGDFVGRGRIESETFVGRSQGEATSSVGDTSAGLRRIRAQDILSRRRLNANVLQIQRGTSARGPIYAPRLEVEFVHPSSATVASDRQAEQTIAKIFASHGLSDATLGVESGMATLRGKVSSDGQKRLAAAVVQLEPGIWKIDNQLQLAGEPVRGAELLKLPQ